MLRYGADILYTLEEDRVTPLIVAAEWGYTDIVVTILRQLNQLKESGNLSGLKYEAYLNAHLHSDRGFTALYIALQHNHWETARVLLKIEAVRADISSSQTVKLNPLMFLQEAPQPELLELILEKLKSQGTIEACIEQIFQPQGTAAEQGGGGNSLLMALRAKEPQNAALLLRYGADILYQFSQGDGATPLILAVQSGYKDVVERILIRMDQLRQEGKLTWLECDHYLNIHSNTDKKSTALNLAEEYMHHDIVKVFSTFMTNGPQNSITFESSDLGSKKALLGLKDSVIFSTGKDLSEQKKVFLDKSPFCVIARPIDNGSRKPPKSRAI